MFLIYKTMFTELKIKKVKKCFKVLHIKTSIVSI